MTILAWLVGSKIGRYAAIAALVALSIGIAVWRIYAAGQAREKARQTEAALKNLRERIAVDDQITKLSPDARRARLARWVSDDE